MIILYNLFQWLLLAVFLPVSPLFLLVPKYRRRIPARLGLGLARRVASLPPGPRIWFHALSVGETASLRPLLQQVRRRRPDIVVILSSTTAGGARYAESLGSLVDCHIPFPFDFWPVAARFVRLTRPRAFVLVETDFWPNILWTLARSGVPCLLVNGRITRESFRRYRLVRPLAASMFTRFSRVTMQMEADARRMAALGVPPERVRACGNLKFDLDGAAGSGGELDLGLPDNALILVAGSTHAGEEEIVAAAAAALKPRFPSLYIIVAPRDPSRGARVAEIAAGAGLRPVLRSAGTPARRGDALVLDSIGELARVYAGAACAFIGGSLVPRGGHNPLEAAAASVPVLFGPHMDDFAEIAAALVSCGGAVQTASAGLTAALENLLADEKIRRRMGKRGREFVGRHRGAAARCLDVVEEVIGHG